MNRQRLKTVAHALATLDPKTDPLFNYSRYATPIGESNPPDVALDKLGPGIEADIAAWTCYSYPDLCGEFENGGDSSWWNNQGLFYWRNAKNILGLTTEQADDLFLNLGDSVSRNDAIMALERLAHS